MWKAFSHPPTLDNMRECTLEWLLQMSWTCENIRLKPRMYTPTARTGGDEPYKGTAARELTLIHTSKLKRGRSPMLGMTVEELSVTMQPFNVMSTVTQERNHNEYHLCEKALSRSHNLSHGWEFTLMRNPTKAVSVEKPWNAALTLIRTRKLTGETPYVWNPGGAAFTQSSRFYKRQRIHTE